MQPGNRVFRFASFPFDHDWSPPVPLSCGLSAVSLGSLDVLDREGETQGQRDVRQAATAASLVPFYGLPGVGHDHFALVADHVQAATSEAADELFFAFLAALRLWRPLPMSFGGSYRAASPEGAIDSPFAAYHQDASAISGPGPSEPESANRYIVSDLKIAAALVSRVRSLSNDDDPQLINAWTCFAQATLGTVGSAQFMVTALFGVLEALLTPGHASGRDLGRRSACALQDRVLGLDVEEWIVSAYSQRRSAFAHGNVLWRTKASAWGVPLTGEAARMVSTIHEIARLCLLRWLSQPGRWRKETQAQRGAGLDALTYRDSPIFRNSVSLLDGMAHQGNMSGRDHDLATGT